MLLLEKDFFYSLKRWPSPRGAPSGEFGLAAAYNLLVAGSKTRS